MTAISLEDKAVIRVAIVEDDASFLQDLVAVIEEAPDMQLVGTANGVAQGRLMLKGPSADVLVVDLGLPDGSGIEVIREAQRLWPDCALVVSTAFGDEGHVIKSIEAGARGYLLKSSVPNRLAEDLRFLHQGGSPISPMIARYVLARFRQTTLPTEAPSPEAPATESPESEADEKNSAKLSARELEVLRYITKGFTYDETAALMKISRYTVMSFVRRVYGKLEVRSKVEAINEARSQGLLDI